MATIPMKAISYFTSLERQGWYFKRPKVEMPEKIESACREVNCNFQLAISLESSKPESHHLQVDYYTTSHQKDQK